MFFSLNLFTLLTFCLWVYVETMTVIPERSNITQLNKKYVTSAVFNVRRYSRKTGYVLNLYGTLVQPWGNDMMIHFIFSQYLHNEYRPSFVETHYKLCELINGEPYVGGMLKQAGFACPLSAGTHNFTNMTAPTKNFPNVFPFEKGRVDITVSVIATKELVIQLYVEASFKQARG